MSEINKNTVESNPIRVKLVGYMIENEFPGCDYVRDKNYGNLAQDILEFIESNYIPKEEHEKVRVRQFNHISRVESEIQELKEENERLKKAFGMTEQSLIKNVIYTEKILALQLAIPELLRLQRVSCSKEFRKNFYSELTNIDLEGSILNAPEPSIEDLNKE